MIHLERVDLPDGLRALAHRDQHGNLVIYVSAGLDAKQQRAAIMEAIRASRRAGWRRAGLLPVGIGLALAIRALLGRVGRVVATRPVAWGAAATATVVGVGAAGIFIASAPSSHAPLAAGPGTVQPSGQQPGAHSPHRRQVRPVSVARPSPKPGRPTASASPTPTSPGGPSPTPTSPGGPSPTPTSPGGPSPTTPAPTPAPSPSPTQTQPCPAPSPHHRRPPRRHHPRCRPPRAARTGTGSPPRICVVVLGITVCLPHVSVPLNG